MSMATTEEGLTFRSAGYIRDELKVSQALLLTLVACEVVRVERRASFPRFCLEDVHAFLKGEHPNGIVSVAHRRKKKDAARAADSAPATHNGASPR
jgi:hypothetical protein